MRTYQMRTLTVDGKKITYPDKLVFAYNPNPIVITGSEQETFSIVGTGKTYNDTRAAYNGKISIDVSRYLQMFVGKDTPSAEVAIKVAGQRLDFTVLWGAINIGEKFNTSRTLPWSIGLPFEVSFYVSGGATVESKTKSQTAWTARTLSEGLHVVDITTWGYDGSEPVYIRMLGGTMIGVFEYTFDYTFLQIDDNSFIIELEPNNCTDGVYLRWIDRHGFIQYRLFVKGETSDKSSTEGEELETDFTDEMPRYGVKVYQGKSIERSVKLGAPNINDEEYERLKMLDSSAWVELYVNGKWVPVRIKTGTVKTVGEHLHDYECEMLLPDIISQSL